VSHGPSCIKKLAAVKQDLLHLPAPRTDKTLTDLVESQTDLELEGWITVASEAIAPASLFGRWSPMRFVRRRRLQDLLKHTTPVVTDGVIKRFLEAANLEWLLRGLRGRLEAIYLELGFPSQDLGRVNSTDLGQYAEWLHDALQRVAALAEIISKSAVVAET